MADIIGLGRCETRGFCCFIDEFGQQLYVFDLTRHDTTGFISFISNNIWLFRLRQEETEFKEFLISPFFLRNLRQKVF